MDKVQIEWRVEKDRKALSCCCHTRARLGLDAQLLAVVRDSAERLELVGMPFCSLNRAVPKCDYTRPAPGLGGKKRSS